MENKKIKLKNFLDERGLLLPFEFNELEFEPKRLFIVKDVPAGLIRGSHSHFTTKQFLICSKGVVDVFLDDGTKKEKITLTQGEAILIPELIWDRQEFMDINSEIIVVCSTEYDINDYIFDYNEFLKIKNNNNNNK